MRFLDVKTDFAFKKVFGSEQSTAILIDFLNAVLEYPPELAIQDLTIVDPYQIPMIKGMKDTYVDVKARLANGKQVIIEMQVLNVKGFEQRILFNAAKSYSLQLQKGQDFSLLNPVIALTLTDFQMFDTPDLTSRFKLIEKQHLLEYSDDIELIFIELPKFNLAETELQSAKDRWLYFVKNAGSLKFIPESLAQEATIHQAFDIANEAGLTEEELEAQDRRFDFIWLQKGWIQKALDDGKHIGEEKGLQKGLLAGKQQGESLILQRQLTKRFGPLPADKIALIAAASSEQLEIWLDKVLDAETLTDVFA
jgi:predicted transposase/invertase (TIGR01784 family)